MGSRNVIDVKWLSILCQFGQIVVAFCIYNAYEWYNYTYESFHNGILHEVLLRVRFIPSPNLNLLDALLMRKEQNTEYNSQRLMITIFEIMIYKILSLNWLFQAVQRWERLNVFWEFNELSIFNVITKNIQRLICFRQNFLSTVISS